METLGVNTGVGHLCGKDHSNQASHRCGSSIPSSTSSTDKQCHLVSPIDSRDTTSLSSGGILDRRDKGRVAMVGSRSVSPQSNTSGNLSTRYDNRDRCLPGGLGCPVSGAPNRGAVVCGREGDAHQCTGVATSVPCTKSFCQR